MLITQKCSGSFEEVREKAFEGSVYDGSEYIDEEVTVFGVVVALLLSFGLPIGLIIWIRKLKKKSAEKKRQRFSERFGYFRDIPNEGSLSATYALGRRFDVCVDGVQTTVASHADAIDEIRKHKALLEEGLISQQEFDAKKRQLLGI
jgi:hypothetical protein